MTNLQPVDEIFASWRRCISSGVDRSVNVINTGINEAVLQNALSENKLLGSIFDEVGDDFEDLSLMKNVVLLLINPEGLLLKKNAVGS